MCLLPPGAGQAERESGAQGEGGKGRDQAANDNAQSMLGGGVFVCAWCQPRARCPERPLATAHRRRGAAARAPFGAHPTPHPHDSMDLLEHLVAGVHSAPQPRPPSWPGLCRLLGHPDVPPLVTRFLSPTDREALLLAGSAVAAAFMPRNMRDALFVDVGLVERGWAGLSFGALVSELQRWGDASRLCVVHRQGGWGASIPSDLVLAARVLGRGPRAQQGRTPACRWRELVVVEGGRKRGACLPAGAALLAAALLVCANQPPELDLVSCASRFKDRLSYDALGHLLLAAPGLRRLRLPACADPVLGLVDAGMGAACARVAALETLECGWLSVRSLERLAGLGVPCRLRRLRCWVSAIEYPSWERALAGWCGATLEWLELHMALDSSGVVDLLTQPWPAMRRLSWQGSQAPDFLGGHVELWVRHPRLERLTACCEHRYESQVLGCLETPALEALVTANLDASPCFAPSCTLPHKLALLCVSVSQQDAALRALGLALRHARLETLDFSSSVSSEALWGASEPPGCWPEVQAPLLRQLRLDCPWAGSVVDLGGAPRLARLEVWLPAPFARLVVPSRFLERLVLGAPSDRVGLARAQQGWGGWQDDGDGDRHYYCHHCGSGGLPCGWELSLAGATSLQLLLFDGHHGSALDLLAPRLRRLAIDHTPPMSGGAPGRLVRYLDVHPDLLVSMGKGAPWERAMPPLGQRPPPHQSTWRRLVQALAAPFVATHDDAEPRPPSGDSPPQHESDRIGSDRPTQGT